MCAVQTLETCSVAPVDPAEPNCPLQLDRWLNQWQSYFEQMQAEWGCCGLDPNDAYALNPLWNTTCPPPNPTRMLVCARARTRSSLAPRHSHSSHEWAVLGVWV
jgi:hypothetical protein